MRLTRDGALTLKNPLPPPNCTAMRLRQISYLGNFLTVEIRRDGWSVRLVDGSDGGALYMHRSRHPLGWL